MSIKNNKASNKVINSKQYKLYDFSESLEKFVEENSKIKFNVPDYDFEVIKEFYEWGYLFKLKFVYCDECKSRKCIEYGNIPRKLHILDEGYIECKIKRYLCTDCFSIFHTDISYLVEPGSNITRPIKDYVLEMYSLYNPSIYKIQKDLERNHMVTISERSIQNIIYGAEYDDRDKYDRFSGHYIFDALWVENSGRWMYLLALFDVKFNTIVSYSLVESESEEEIFKFLSESTYNKNRNTIVTDLKKEYRRPIWRLGFKHQFCHFHVKQKINRDVSDYIRKNNLSDEDIGEIVRFKKIIFGIFDCDSLEDVESIRDELINSNDDLPEPIFSLVWDLIVPYFKNLTLFYSDSNVERTSNKLENTFKHVFNKHIKKMMRSVGGIVARFGLKLKEWDKNNRIL